MENDSSSNEPLGRQLVFTAKAMREAFQETLAGAGGSLGTWVVLSALSDVGCVSQAALAGHVHLEGATITHHIDRLEALGLVSRRVSPDDRRVRLLELTEPGAALHERLLTAVKEFETQATAGLGVAEQTALRVALARIRGNLAGIRGAQPSAA
jgi:MarR family transcriptional regulator for hemolysin